jgi:DNA-binding MarR family transcriptional regulator
MSTALNRTAKTAAMPDAEASAKAPANPSATATATPHAAAMRAWLSVVRCYQLCNDEIAAGLKPLGLKVQHYDVLARLAARPGQTQQQLAKSTFVVKSHMSTLINEMVALGWVLRTDSAIDRRSNTVSLTPNGYTMVKKAAKVQLAVMTAMFAPLLPQQIAAIETSTALVVQALTTLADRRPALNAPRNRPSKN